MTEPSRPVLRVVPGVSTDDTVVRDDLVAILTAIGSDVARLGPVGPVVGPALRARWDAVRRLAEPDDLDGLAAHAASLQEAAGTVRRQHTETAEDLGPLWDTWAGPAAEAVQDRVSALARSAHALVVELEDTAAELVEAHDRVVAALATLADELERPTPDEPLAACDRAAEECTAAWAQARRVLAGGSVSGCGPRFP